MGFGFHGREKDGFEVLFGFWVYDILESLFGFHFPNITDKNDFGFGVLFQTNINQRITLNNERKT